MKIITNICTIYLLNNKERHIAQCFRNYNGTSAFADVSYLLLLADVDEYSFTNADSCLIWMHLVEAFQLTTVMS